MFVLFWVEELDSVCFCFVIYDVLVFCVCYVCFEVFNDSDWLFGRFGCLWSMDVLDKLLSSLLILIFNDVDFGDGFLDGNGVGFLGKLLK